MQINNKQADNVNSLVYLTTIPAYVYKTIQIPKTIQNAHFLINYYCT